jgi:hypothetical protein
VISDSALSKSLRTFNLKKAKHYSSLLSSLKSRNEIRSFTSISDKHSIVFHSLHFNLERDMFCIVFDSLSTKAGRNINDFIKIPQSTGDYTEAVRGKLLYFAGYLLINRTRKSLQTKGSHLAS